MNSNDVGVRSRCLEIVKPEALCRSGIANGVEAHRRQSLPISRFFFCSLFFLLLGNVQFPRSDILFTDVQLRVEGVLGWNQLSLKRLGYQLLELLHAGQFVHILKPKAHKKFLCCFIENWPAYDLLASRSCDELAIEQRPDHSSGIDSTNVVNLGHSHRLLVGDHGQSLQCGKREANGRL
jgi:hypothetical protein